MGFTVRLNKDGELIIPEEAQEFFPKGQLVRITTDETGRIIIKTVHHLRLCSNEEAAREEATTAALVG